LDELVLPAADRFGEPLLDPPHVRLDVLVRVGVGGEVHLGEQRLAEPDGELDLLRAELLAQHFLHGLAGPRAVAVARHEDHTRVDAAVRGAAQDSTDPTASGPRERPPSRTANSTSSALSSSRSTSCMAWRDRVL